MATQAARRGSQAGCSVAGCERPHEALGLCRAHYDERYRRQYAIAHPEYAAHHRAMERARYHRQKFRIALRVPPSRDAPMAGEEE